MVIRNGEENKEEEEHEPEIDSKNRSQNSAWLKPDRPPAMYAEM